MQITYTELKRFCPQGKINVLQAIETEAESGSFEHIGLTTPVRVCHFFAQIGVESGGLRIVEENLSYSARRLTQVWPKRFPSLKDAEPFAKNPPGLAEKVYGGRMGNTAPGDGWRYRGRGLKQLTGRDNYRAFTGWVKRIWPDAPDFEAEPDLVAKDPWMVRSALFYWDHARCNRYADKNNIRAVTRAVNGGYNGLADRRAYFRRACDVWDEEETISRIGTKPLASKTGKASIVGLVGAGAAAAGPAMEAIDQATLAIESGRGLSDALGVDLLTVVLILAVAGLILYILRDRFFIAKHEGL